MTKTQDELKREFAEKWSLDEYAEITLDGYRKKECLSDLNALLDKLMLMYNTMEWLLMDDALKCPHCGGVGFTVKPNYNTGEPEQEQCRWCHEFEWYRSCMKGTDK